MERINNILYYLIVVVLIGFAAFFLHSYALARVTVGFVLLPLVSFVLHRLTYKRLYVRFDDNEPAVKRNEDCTLRITLVNKGFSPILNLDFTAEIKNAFNETPQQRYINASVPMLGKRVIYLKYKPLICGRIDVSINELKSRDFLSFFKAVTPINEKLAINVMPCGISLKASSVHSEGVSDETVREHKDITGSDVIDQREYARGDSLKLINWKLSAKKDELFVREKGDNISDRSILLFELEKGCINDILDTVYTLLKQLASSKTPVKVCWAGSGDEQLRFFNVDGKDDIYPLFERVYRSQATLSATHTLEAAKRQLTGGSVMYISSASEGVSTVNL